MCVNFVYGSLAAKDPESRFRPPLPNSYVHEVDTGVSIFCTARRTTTDPN